MAKRNTKCGWTDLLRWKAAKWYVWNQSRFWSLDGLLSNAYTTSLTWEREKWTHKATKNNGTEDGGTAFAYVVYATSREICGGESWKSRKGVHDVYCFNSEPIKSPRSTWLVRKPLELFERSGLDHRSKVEMQVASVVSARLRQVC